MKIFGILTFLCKHLFVIPNKNALNSKTIFLNLEFGTYLKKKKIIWKIILHKYEKGFCIVNRKCFNSGTIYRVFRNLVIIIKYFVPLSGYFNCFLLVTITLIVVFIVFFHYLYIFVNFLRFFF